MTEKLPDIEGWKAEFYPVAIETVSKEAALQHSLTKWKGFRKENLNKYGLMEPPISVTTKTCALCYHFYVESTCDDCPLCQSLGAPCDSMDNCTLEMSPYWSYVYSWSRSPELMIKALADAIRE